MFLINNESVTKRSRVDSLMLRFIISYSIFLLVILVLAVTSLTGYTSSLKTEYNRSQRSSYLSKIELFENDFKIMDTTCRQLLQNTDFRKIMNISAFTDTEAEIAQAVKSDLAVSILADSLLPLKELFFYLRSSDYIINDSYFITADNYYNWVKRYPDVLKSSWREIICTDFFEYISLNDYRYSGENYYMYIIDMNDLTYMESDVSAVFVMSKDEMKERFGFDNDELAYSYMKVFDKSGKQILSYSENDSFPDIDVTSLEYNDDFSNITVGDQTVSVMKYVSANTGYVYYITFPAYIVLNITTLIMVIVVSSVVVLGISLIIWLSRRNVMPIIEMNEQLDQTTEEKVKLEGIVEKQMPIIHQTYVRQLLLSGISSEAESISLSASLGIQDSKYFKAMHVVVYNNSSDEASSDSESFFLTEEVLNYIITHLSASLGKTLHYFISGEHSFSVLLDFDDEEHKDYLLKVQSAVLALHNSLLTDYNLWLFAGIGKTTQTLLNVWESYEQAVNAITYTSKNYIFLPYEYIKKDSANFYYPQEFSNKLVYFVTNGNEAQALDLLRLIRKENIDERSLSSHLMNFLLTDIRNSLLKAKFELPSSISDDEIKAVDEKFNDKISFPILEDITVNLCKLFNSASTDGNLIDSIITYIKENYSDSLMCLSKISDEFNISETYFSHLFKDKTGVNFSTYLENIRMSKAMDLLKSGEASLNSIYEEVGYNNANSFRRAFKKVYGITPGSVLKE